MKQIYMPATIWWFLQWFNMVAPFYSILFCSLRFGSGSVMFCGVRSLSAVGFSYSIRRERFSYGLVCFEHSICFYGNKHQYNAIVRSFVVRPFVNLHVLMLMRRSVHDSFICLIALHFIRKVFRPKIAWKHWTANEKKKKMCAKRLRFLLQLIPNEFYNQFKFVHSTMLSTTQLRMVCIRYLLKIGFQKWKTIKENWETFWRKPI